ncbi:hypothetical protein BWI75_09165 [Gloeocapsopsis sp. AAB1 = 1H9]|uniref:Uncharacterized protein n=1 Tax=Gloeocapsopsis dulcis AAB1 = 1H9 TaxID=1433147 RepID=A0A6N8FUR4_9CHRO|nr:hypothetical protein [Gloeocapsopsis dulcis AAB1 = 1H9]
MQLFFELRSISHRNFASKTSDPSSQDTFPQLFVYYNTLQLVLNGDILSVIKRILTIAATKVIQEVVMLYPPTKAA